jgi:hypothetical protein
MMTMKQFEKGLKKFERGVEQFAKDIAEKFETAKPHIKRSEKKEKFFLKRIAAKKGCLRSYRGKCEWCEKKGMLYRTFNRAWYAHALCKHCQSDRVHMLGYGLI